MRSHSRLSFRTGAIYSLCCSIGRCNYGPRFKRNDVRRRQIGKIRSFLSSSATEHLIHAFVSSKLDYCNSILLGLPSYEFEKLQRLQNTAARLTVRAKKSAHITPVLKSLHWLPVKERIIFKILLVTYKIVHGFAPAYLNELLLTTRLIVYYDQVA